MKLCKILTISQSIRKQMYIQLWNPVNNNEPYPVYDKNMLGGWSIYPCLWALFSQPWYIVWWADLDFGSFLSHISTCLSVPHLNTVGLFEWHLLYKVFIVNVDNATLHGHSCWGLDPIICIRYIIWNYHHFLLCWFS